MVVFYIIIMPFLVCHISDVNVTAFFSCVDVKNISCVDGTVNEIDIQIYSEEK